MAGPEPVGGIALVTCADDDLSRLSSPAPTRSPMLTHTGLVRQPRARIRRAPGIRAHWPGHTAGRARRVRPGQQRPARGQELLIGPAFPPVRERVPVALARPGGRPRSCGRWRRAVLAGRDKQAVRARRHGRAKQPPLGQMQVLGLVIRARPCTWHPTPRPLSFRNCDSRSGAAASCQQVISAGRGTAKPAPGYG